MSDIHKGNHGAANPNICQNRDGNLWWLGCVLQSVFSQSPKTHCVIKLKQFIFYPDLGSVDCRYFNCLKSFIYIFFVSNAINEKLVSIVYVEAEGKGGGGLYFSQVVYRDLGCDIPHWDRREPATIHYCIVGSARQQPHCLWATQQPIGNSSLFNELHQ